VADNSAGPKKMAISDDFGMHVQLNANGAPDPYSLKKTSITFDISIAAGLNYHAGLVRQTN
jgi:hypothetical protein